jgi:L-asparaginase II
MAPLVEQHRGGLLECMHIGVVAVSDAQGRLLAHVGDPQWMGFTRSTLKPFQALPFLRAEGPQQLGYGREELAMLCSSHSGEPMHVARVDAMLARSGLQPSRLQCGCRVPLFAHLGIAPAPPEGSFDARHHNCSVKHSGFLAYCVQQGLPLESYLEPLHPLQQAIRREVAVAAGLPQDAIRMGIDGCSAPNYAMPLSALAAAYARLAAATDSAGQGAHFKQLADAMVSHPELVSGTCRNDLAFMQAGRGDWLTKVGADGVQAVASRSRGQGFAIKVMDGSKVALHAATVEVLEQLGWLDDSQRKLLEPWRERAVLNARGLPVGERKTVLRLQRA